MTSRQRSELVAGTAEQHAPTYLTSKSTRDCRLSARSRKPIRKAADVRIVSGRGTEARSSRTRQPGESWSEFKRRMKQYA